MASGAQSEATDTAPGQQEAAEPALDDFLLLQILSALPDDHAVVETRAVSKRVRDLADCVLEENFKRRWGVAGIAQPPPAPPAYAAARPVFALCHRLAGKESLAGLAVRHGTDVVALKRLNNMISDGALASRSHLYIPVADPAEAAASKRVAFVHDSHSKRRFVVILGEGEELPAALASGGAAGQRHASGSSQAFVVAKLARVLERALRIDAPTATYYVQQAGCDVRAAIEKFEEDRRWERQMSSAIKRLERASRPR